MTIGHSASQRSACEETHFDASQLYDVVVVELPGLRTDGLPVDERVVTFLATLDVDDEIALCTTRYRRNLDAGAAERGQRLGKLQLAARKSAAQDL